jgi:phosphoribosylamine-glycine ligase
MTDLSKKTCIVYDRGAYTYMAQFLSRFFGKVQYATPSAGIYEKSSISQVGEGLPGVEWIDNIWKHLDKADMVFFPYVYDGDLQELLRKKGMPVCGSGKSEKMELDKAFFKTVLDKVGLRNINTRKVRGVDAVWKFLKDKKEKYVCKNAEKYRGDFETFTHNNPHQTKLFLDDVHFWLGPERSKEIEILIEDWLEAEIETGCDGFRLDGDMAPNTTIGYEVKDEGYVCKVFKELPPIIRKVTDKLGPAYKAGGYRGPYSNEMRITKDGKVYPIDETCRCGSPPTPVISELYGESYAQGIWDLAHGKMPTIKPTAKYGAEIILRSSWYTKHELYVGCPKDFEGKLKLHNAVMRSGQYYCIPDLTEEMGSDFGSVVGMGNTVKEATDKALAALKELDVFHLVYKENLFDEVQETIKKGEALGIPFG